jgi:ACS family hexuronate transporter-like MFS transporter
MTLDLSRRNHYGWLVVALLFLGSVLNYMDRAALGVVMPRVRRDLHLTNQEYGLAVNAFLLAYMVFYILGGRLADRLGCRRAFSVMVVFWSVANMLHAFASGLKSLCAFRALLGIGEGGFYPTAMRGATEWFAPEKRAKAVGVFLCGISVGTLLTQPLVAWITHQHGWRTAFLVTGGIGLLLIPPWLVTHRMIRRAYGTADPAPAATSSTAGSDGGPSLGDVLRRRKYWLILFSRAVTDAVWFFYLFWMPGYFQDVRGFNLKMVGSLLWIPYLAADFGAIGGAWASSHLIERGWGLDRSRKTLLLVSAALCVIGSNAYLASDAYTALALVSVALLGHLSWSSNIQTVITEITPQRHVAMLYGITGAVGTGMGALTQPVIGRVVDTLGYSPGFAGCGMLFLLASALLLAAGRIEKL